MFWVNFINLALVVGQYRGAIWSQFRQFGACPIEDGHKIVANKVYAFLSQHIQGLYIGIDIFIASLGAGFDIVVYIYAFNAGYFQIVFCHIIF